MKVSKIHDYPYYFLYKNDKDILSDFNELKKLNLLTDKTTLNTILFIVDNFKFSKKFYNITNYFSEKVRMNCTFGNNESPYERYQKDKNSLIKKNLDFEDMREYLYNQLNYKECTNFKTTIAKSIYDYFQPTTILDPSMGWGDRLIGALAYDINVEYIGTDPSNEMKDIYPIINNFFKQNIKNDKNKFIQSPFEKADIKENYFDLIFTSPPFFDLETYEISENTEQSINNFKTLEEWKNNFLYILISKSRDALKINGHLVLYISDYTVDKKTYQFVDDLLKHIEKTYSDLPFIGTINFTLDGKKIRNIYVWRKN